MDETHSCTWKEPNQRSELDMETDFGRRREEERKKRVDSHKAK